LVNSFKRIFWKRQKTFHSKSPQHRFAKQHYEGLHSHCAHVKMGTFFHGIRSSKLRTEFMQTAWSVWSIYHQNLPTWYSLPSGENIVMCLSNPALLPLAMLLSLGHGCKLCSTDYTTDRLPLHNVNCSRDLQIG
jgi:hypothetical protein